MKRWYKSKTIWINVISMAIMALGTAMNWPEFSGMTAQFVFGINILNLALRLITFEGLE
jgi:hypothetical protein